MLTFKRLITEYVESGIKYVSEINNDGKRELVAALIRELNPIDSNCLLSDIDKNNLFGQLISDVVLTNGNEATSHLLIDEIKNCLLSHFDSDIDWALEEAYMSLHYSKDNTEQFLDSRERAKDVNLTLKDA